MSKVFDKLIYLSVFLVLLFSASLSARSDNSEQGIIQQSEQLIDSFYSFDKARLNRKLVDAKSSIPSLVFYQGWAQGGNYKIVKREPCYIVKAYVVRCAITVQDDLMLALGIDFNVTDTFDVTFSDNKLTEVATSSNDLDVFWQAREWVKKHHAALIAKPCQGIWNGGPTPGDCVRAMVEGYKRFAKSDAFTK